MARKTKTKAKWSYKKYRGGRGSRGLRGVPADWTKFEERMAAAYAAGQIDDGIREAVGRLGAALRDLDAVNGRAVECDEIPDRADHVKRMWNVVKAALTPAEAALASRAVTAATGAARATCAHPRAEASLPPSRQRGMYPAARMPECGIVCKIKKFFS